MFRNCCKHSPLVFHVLAMLVMLTMLGDRVQAQAPDVVFQSAYERTFKVVQCLSGSPPTVIIEAPSADDPLSYVPLDNGSLVTLTGIEGSVGCNVTDNPINVVSPTSFQLTGVIALSGGIGGVGTTNTLSSDLPSPPLPNVGQVGHLISVEFPTAPGPGAVTPVQVRLEASSTCPDPPFCAMGDWRPISTDVTSVSDIGGVAYYEMDFSNGAWRALRINSILATPSGLPMRVDYTGMPIALGGIINEGDFFIIVPPGGSSYPDGGLEFVAGACQNGAASLAFNGGTTTPLPEAQCIEDDQELAVAAFDDTTTEAVQDAFLLAPQGTPSVLQVKVEYTAAGTGTAQASVIWACGTVGDTLGSITWSSATTATLTVGTANELAQTQFNVPLSGCLASDFLFWQWSRTGGVGTLSGDLLVKSINFLPNQ